MTLVVDASVALKWFPGADDLRALSIPVRDDPLILARATELAREPDHHLFDTPYHAVALAEPDALLVTAGATCLAEARGRGRAVALADRHPG